MTVVAGDDVDKPVKDDLPVLITELSDLTQNLNISKKPAS